MDFSEILPEAGHISSANKKESHLLWKSPRELPQSSNNLGDSPSFRASPHKWFNTMLRQGDVCDLEQIEVPGAIIMLPWGVKIVERFAQLLQEEAEKCGYDEYSYPCLIPKSYFKSLSDLIDFKNSTLSVTTHSDNVDLALTPTGEYPIYHHWHSIIKSKMDLPKRLYQRAKYFRPLTSAKRSGGSVFLSMEASDIFEFHSAFANDTDASNETMKLLSLFKRIAEKTRTFVLWTMRPTWTNRGYLYKWCYGGDAVLPSHHSVQVACAYYQADVFSRRFNISFKEGSEVNYTSQATGAITRRMVFANLFQTIRADGSLCLHPNIAPIQVSFLASACNVEDENSILQICDELRKHNIRLKYIKTESKKQLRKEEKNWYRLGIPLKIMYFGRQNFDSIKIILVRNDTGEEYPLAYQEVVPLVKLALQDIENQQPVQRHHNIIQCSDMEEIESILQHRKIASITLSIDPNCVQRVEQLKQGEVLGYYSDNSLSQCIITGEMTQSRAFVSRRI